MMFWALQVLNGVSFGMLLFLLGAGLSLIYGVMRILNLAHGSYYVLGAYVALSTVQATGSFLLAAVAGTAAVTVLGITKDEDVIQALAPGYLLRDRDGIYGPDFSRRVERLGIREVRIAPRAPWQNPFVERVIGSLRRECLDHFVILSEAHLRRLLHSYRAYYNHSRPYQGLENNSPIPRAVQPSSRGRIHAAAEVGGLHHRYQRVA
jgi:transposase InsO family protein